VRIGFIGAGRMGRPMVTRLVEAGHDVAVLGRTTEKRTAIAQLGADPVADTAEVGVRADAVILCLFTDEQVRQVCLDDDLPATMPPGSALVVHTTGSPRTVEAIAVRAARHDVDVVDAPVSGGPHNAAAGALTLFVGGAENAVTRVGPVLSCYGDPVLHVGPLGAGQKVKLVNNALVACWISSPRADPSRPSKTPRANSSAKTLPWPGVSPPNWAVTSGCSTTSSARPSGHEMRSFRPAMNGLPLALQSSIPS
jgi:2-hydroxy-3-oxopropionate reductase